MHVRKKQGDEQRWREQVRMEQALGRLARKRDLVRVLGVWGGWLTVTLKGRGMLIAASMVSVWACVVLAMTAHEAQGLRCILAPLRVRGLAHGAVHIWHECLRLLLSFSISTRMLLGSPCAPACLQSLIKKIKQTHCLYFNHPANLASVVQPDIHPN
jgi:hypothetical protein